MELRPIQYHLECYEGSFISDPSLSVSSSTPVPTFSVGDIVDHRGDGSWQRPPGSGEGFRVAEVRHLVWSIQGSHIGYKLMVRLEVVRLPRDP